jgi:hypothetical protein
MELLFVLCASLKRVMKLDHDGDEAMEHQASESHKIQPGNRFGLSIEIFGQPGELRRPAAPGRARRSPTRDEPIEHRGCW